MTVLVLILLMAFQQTPLPSKSNAVEALFIAVETGDRCEKRRTFTRVHRVGKSAIPELIEKIGTDRKVLTTELRDPTSSVILPGDLDKNFAGAWALFAIDAILTRVPERETVWRKEPEKCDFLFESYERDRYRSSTVVRNRSNRAVTHKDMLEVQRLYRVWWEKKNNKSLEELKSDWKNGDRPLKGTVYQW